MWNPKVTPSASTPTRSQSSVSVKKKKMVGVCTPKCDLRHGIRRFCSLLGRDEESWGYFYTGTVRHAAKFRQYGPWWGKGNIVGIHLDSWRGTLEFILNRKPLGVAVTGLQNKELCPIVTSTSAYSGMKLVTSCTFPADLQFLSSEGIFKHLCEKVKMCPEDLPLPPGLWSFVANNYWPFLWSVGQTENEYSDQKWSASSSKHYMENDPLENPMSKRRHQQTLCQIHTRSPSAHSDSVENLSLDAHDAASGDQSSDIRRNSVFREFVRNSARFSFLPLTAVDQQPLRVSSSASVLLSSWVHLASLSAVRHFGDLSAEHRSEKTQGKGQSSRDKTLTEQQLNDIR